MSTTTSRLQRAEEILFRVATLPDREREAEIARLRGTDAGLADEVASLLDHARRMGDFLEAPALGTDFVLLPARAAGLGANGPERDEMVGRTVGRYRIERRIASGGMGTVYQASRADEQFTQRVAMKIVKRGMDSDEILLRFRRERQTLAALEHPNIARLVDGGATASGQPYLVMEFVDGESIDAYCDRRRLDVDARLELFLAVCDAVRFAHQNLVVHRDLKPGNILVTSEGVPKLLDFGIAAVVDEDRAHDATAAGHRRLTPEYASPEQIAGEPVTTTSDVYSLGVILYELLSGQRPYLFETRSTAEIQRVVVDTEPRPPSEKVRFAPTVEAGEAADARGCTPEQLVRRLRGDLDTIVLFALGKDPRRRYPSVERLAADVRRHLDRLPVSARRDTLAYRTSKFVRRHALASTLGVFSLVLLVAGGAAFAWQARVAGRERDAALTARAQSEAATGFLQRMLSSADPSRSGRNVSVRDVLDEAARHLDRDFADQPLVQASLHKTIGSTYLALGLYEQAESHLRRAYAQRLALLGPRSNDVAESMGDLAVLLHATGAFDEAGALLEDAVRILRGTQGPDSVDAATMLGSLGAIRRSQGRLDEAEALQREALDVRRRRTGDDSLDVAESLNNLAYVLATRGRMDEAQRVFEEALRIRRERLGEEHVLVAQSLDNLAMILVRRGDLDGAEPLCTQALDLEIRLLGDSHPEVAVTRRNLARLLVQRGRLPAAEDQLRECLAVRERVFDASDVRRVSALLDLAEVLVAQDRADEAAPLVELALDSTRDLAPAEESRQAVLARGPEILERCGLHERAVQLRSESHVTESR